MSLIKLTGSIIEANTITSENIATGAITQNNLAQGLSLSGIRISAITYPGDDTAANTAGGQSVVLTGAGFESGAAVLIDYVSVGSVTVTNSTSISFTAPAKSAGGYLVHVINPDGATAIHVPGIQYSGTPTWSTAAGSVGTFYEYGSVSNTVTATSDSTVQYSVVSGSLPTGATMNGNGVITGTAPAESGATTFTFTVRANDAENQSTDRTFTITVNPDVVSWSAPANNATITTYEYVPISNTFAATSAAGKSVSYAADVLPANVSISGATVSGTPTTVGNTTSVITATAATTGKTSTQTLNFAVQQDSVTWSSPANNTTYTLAQNVANTTSMSATSAAGFNVSYSANVLPTGMSISGATITGTPTAVGNTTSLITATAATTNRTATRVFNWVVILAGDTYWNSTSLLLSSNTSIQPASVLTDASISSSQITSNGDVSAASFNPHQHGFYSISHGTTSNGWQTPAGSAPAIIGSTTLSSTSTFTFEAWIYQLSRHSGGGSALGYVFGSMALGGGTVNWSIGPNSSGNLTLFWYNSGNVTCTAAVIPLNVWTHIAVCLNAGVITMFINGVAQTLSGTTTATTTSGSSLGYLSSGGYLYGGSTWQGFNGYISNMRVVRDTVLYNGSFTPSTSPLTVVANTTLLVGQSNSIRDNSPMNNALTLTNIPAVSPAHPFLTKYQANSTQYYSNYFSGSNYALGSLATGITIGTSDFCLEGWGYWTSFNNGTYGSPIISLYGDTAGELMIRANKTAANTTSANWFSILGASTYIPSGMYTSGISGGTLYLNRWHHLAVSRKSGVWSFFLDGTRVSTTSAGDASLTLAFNKAYIGADGPSGGGYMTGQVSNVRLVTGDYVYDGATYTVPTSPLTAITGTKMLTAQDSTFKDNSGYTTYTFTQSNTNTQPAAVSPFTVPSYSNTEITSFGSAYFDGTGDYVVVPHNTAHWLGANNFTIEMWIYSTKSGEQTLISKTWQGAAAAYASYLLYIEAGNTFRFLGSSNGGTWDFDSGSSTSTLKQSVWTHVALTRSGSTFSLFINGALDKTITNAGTLYNHPNDIIIGAAGSGTGYGATFKGYMSNVRIVRGTALYTSNFVPQFNAPLTAIANTKLLTLQNNTNHNNNGFKDLSVFDNTFARTSNPTSGTFGPHGDNWSTYFDGTGDYLQTTTSAFGLGSVFTFEAWVYPTALTSGAIVFASTASGEFSIGYNGTTRFGVSARAVSWILDSTTLPTLNTWNHVAVCRGGLGTNQTSLYINGARVATGTVNNAFTTLSTWQVGYDGGGGGSVWAGYISNLRVVAGTDVYGYSNSTITPPSSPLTAIANTKLLTCQSNRLIDNSINNFTITRTGDVSIQKFSPFSSATVPTYYSSLFTRSATDYYTFTPGVLGGQGTAFTVEFWIYLNSLDSSPFRTAGGLELHVDSTGHLKVGHSEVADIFTTASVVFTTGAWYHVAVTRTTGNLYTAYVNGTSVGSNTYATSFGTLNTHIGFNSFSHSTYGMNGYISNLRTTTTVVYTGNFTPPTSPLSTTQASGTNISAITSGQTTLLTMNAATPVDATNSRTLTMANNPKVLAVSPFTPTAADATAYTSNTYSGSMYFDGNDMIGALTNRTMTFGTGDFTVDYWVYPTAFIATFQTHIGSSTTSGGFSFGLDGSNKLYKTTYTTGVSGTTTLQANRWYHVAWTRSGGTVKAFLNGVLDYSATDTTDITETQFGVGGQPSGTLYPCGASYLSDVRVVKGVSLYNNNFYPPRQPPTPNATLGANTYAAALLLSGTPSGAVDATRTTMIETVGNTVVTRSDPYSGNYYSNYFDGSGDYITAPASSSWDFGTGDFTIECWINQSVITSTDQVIAFHGWSGSGGFNYGWNLRTTATTGVLGFSVPTSGIDQRQFTDLVVKVGQWHHVAICCTGGVVSAYLDGVKSATTYSGASFVARATATLVLGGWNDNNEQIAERYWYTGHVSNFRIVKGNALYSASFTPSTSPLTAVGNTQVLVCATNRFIDSSSSNVALTTAGNVAVKSQNPFRVNSGVSYYFDGSGDYLASPLGLPALGMGTGDFTVEGWIYNTQADSYVFLDFRNESTLDFVLNNSGTGMQMNNGGTTLLDTGANAFKWNEWVHFMARRVSGVGTIHINGVQKANGAVTTDFGATGSFTLGTAGDARGNASYDFGAGYLADVRVTKGVGRPVAVPIEPHMVK